MYRQPYQTVVTNRIIDPGYYIRYRISRAYHNQAANKRLAVPEIIGITNPQDFLERSGYDPHWYDWQGVPKTMRLLRGAH